MSSSPLTSVPSFHYDQYSRLNSIQGGYGAINGDTTPVEATSFVTVPLNLSSTRKVQKMTLSKGYYYGEVLSGQKDGTGTQYDEKENVIYHGDWVKNKKHGTGTSFDPATRLTYTGQWADDSKQGAGTITQFGGTIYFEGIFMNDKPYSKIVEGEGTYVGEWEDGQLSSGVFTDLNGKVFHYDNGQIVETTKCCIIL